MLKFEGCLHPMIQFCNFTCEFYKIAMTTFGAKFLDTINKPKTHDCQLNLSPMILRVKVREIIIILTKRA